MCSLYQAIGEDYTGYDEGDAHASEFDSRERPLMRQTHEAGLCTERETTDAPFFQSRSSLSLVRILISTLALGVIPAMAGTPAQVDLSLNVAASPATFHPGGRTTVALTVRNAGPDAAGATTPTPSVVVYGGDFVVTNRPPPYEVVVPADGCAVERFVSEPLPDGNIRLVFVYYFASIPARQRRTCTFDIEFYPSTVASFDNTWRVGSFDNDTNQTNNRLPYTFVAASAAPSSASVPALSALGYMLLIVGLLLAGGSARHRLEQWRRW